MRIPTKITPSMKALLKTNLEKIKKDVVSKGKPKSDPKTKVKEDIKHKEAEQQN